MSTTINKSVKPISIILDTEMSQAEYFFNREFSTVSLELLKNADGILEILEPSIELIISDYFDTYNNEDELKEEYKDLSPDESFFKWVESLDSFDEYRYGDFWDNNYPMWGYAFSCPEFYVDSAYMNTDKLHELGISVIDHETGYYLSISGAGYSFYDAHWIPLFKELGWIEEKINL